MTTYNIDRKTASKLLDVSMRTVDRYLKQEKLSSIRSDGRVWLSKDEILKLINKDTPSVRTSRRDTDSLVVDPVILADNEPKMSNSHSSDNAKKSTFYRPEPHRHDHTELDLINELREEISIKDKRLAQASYKIGQLEAQVSSMIPEIELQKQQKLLAEKAESLEHKIQQKNQEIEQTHKHYINELKEKTAAINQIADLHHETVKKKDRVISKLDRELHLEKVNKWIYAVILYVLVIGLVVLLIVTRGI